jgi:glycosyltransferase involved in cell wall biosynthesis
MPVYNERRTLRTVIGRVLRSPVEIPLELIVVDDCSTDGSVEILRDLAAQDARVKPVFHAANTGKGGAIHTAIKHMTGDVAVIQDADLEYDPAEISRVIRPILDSKADAVFGSRFAGSDYRRVLYYWHRVANSLLTLLANMVCDLDLTDMETCYKAVRADILRQTCLRFERFALEPELTVRLAQWGIRIYEVPISYMGRTYAEGKKIGFRDAVQAVAAILWCGFLDRRFTTHDGYYNMVAHHNARGLNRWIYRMIHPFVGQQVLEAGCGIGNLTEQLLNRQELVAADSDPLYVEMIQRRFGHLENFRTLQIDWRSESNYERLADGSLDTVLCLNVLEHLEMEAGVLKQCFRILRPGGHFIALAPQHPWLFNAMDEWLGHNRRYSIADLRGKLTDAGFEVVKAEGFNKLGGLGWLIIGNFLRAKRVTPRQIKIFNRLLPIAKVLEYVPGLPGLSVIAVGRKAV